MGTGKQGGIQMADEKQGTGGEQDGLTGRLFSKDEAWTKAREIIDKFRHDEEKKFRCVGGFLNLKEYCIEVQAVFRSADLSDRLNEMITGTEYFVGIVKEDAKSFPYAIYKVPYNPTDCRSQRKPSRDSGYKL
jgi:hypothetical protein